MARIMIADDERLVARTLGAQIRQLGHEPVAAVADGHEALESCAGRQPELVLTDYAVPQINGAEAARHIWERHHIAVLMISGYADIDAVQASGEAGAIGYLIKPVGATDLGPAIEIALQRARDLRAARAKADDLENQLRVRKLIERAKGVIMQRQHVTEEAAYRTLQRESRNQRRRMADLAQSVLSAQEILA